MGLDLIEKEIGNQVEAMQLFASGALPVFRNTTDACHWDCKFYGACLMMSVDGEEPTEMLQKVVNTRNGE